MSQETENNSTNTSAEPAQSETPWLDELIRGKAAMAEAIESGKEPGFRSAEFWQESSWPLHTIEIDHANAKHCGNFLVRLADKGLFQAMNVMLNRSSAHVVGQAFGFHAYSMSKDYEILAALNEKRAQDIAKAAKEGKPAPNGEEDADDGLDFEKMSKGKKALHYAAYGAGIQLVEKKPLSPSKHNEKVFAHKLKANYKIEKPQSSPEEWSQAAIKAKELCDKFGLRLLSIPLSFEAADAVAFVGKLDDALTRIADFVGVPCSALGLDKWLGLKARAPGELDIQKANEVQDAEALAEKEREAEMKKKSDSEHGMFSGGFIQIEVSPNFEPVVLAHEWFHSLDLWFGSKEIVAKQPWQGWNMFASRVAFSDYEQSPALRAWREELMEGGQGRLEFGQAIPESKFLSQMRFGRDDAEPQDEFYKPLAERVSAQLMRLFDKFELPAEKIEETKTQSLRLAEALEEAAKENALDFKMSQQSAESLARQRKAFFEEWGGLASDWLRRQAQGGATDDKIDDAACHAQAIVLKTLTGAWFWSHLGYEVPKPDVHMQQAMRMDIDSGRTSPYFCTPHEMLAYKLEELFLAFQAGAEPEPGDKVASSLLSWLRDEASPALQTVQSASFESVMGVKTKAKP